MVSVKISASDNPKKKLKAVFTRDNGRTVTRHFGSRGMDDYTITKDKEQRKRYRSRHKKDLQTNDYTRAGYLSYFLLWGDKPTLAGNLKDYKKKFKLD